MNYILPILKRRESLLSFLIFILIILVSSLSSNFLTYENITNILKASSVTGIFSLGVLLVIISGGFDVSFSAIAQVSQYFSVWMLLNYLPQGGLLVTFFLAITVGGLLGLFNGYLIDHFSMPAIIITISTQNLFYGVMYVITKGRLLYEVPSYIWPLSNTKIFEAVAANGATYGISMVTVVWIVLAIGLAIFLKYTMIGRSIYWIGGNKRAAQRIGINTKRTTILVYIIAGMIAGIAAIAHVSIVQTVIPNSIVGTELPVIAVVILGGASIKGGKGSVWGTVLGVILFAIVSNSLTLLQISSYWYNVFTGGIIITSVILNALQEIQQQKRIIRVNVSPGKGALS